MTCRKPPEPLGTSDGAPGVRSPMAFVPGPWSAPQQCFLCRHVRERTADCQRRERIESLLERDKPGRLMWPVPPAPLLCKACCIGQLAGHGCEWWGLCWR